MAQWYQYTLLLVIKLVTYLKLYMTVFLLVTFASTCLAADPITSSPPGKTGTITFQDKSSFSTTLYDLRYLGQLQTKNKKPYLVLAGRGCDDCDAGTAIYIHSPSDGPMQGEGGQERYSYPGRYKDSETGELVEKTRAFLGTCIPGRREGVVWYMQWMDKKGKWQVGFLIAEVVNDEIKSKYLPKPKEKLGETLQFVKRDICKELRGIDGYTEP